MKRPSRLLRLIPLTVLLIGLLAPPAFAKPPEERYPPYDVQGLPHKRIWVPWVFAFLFAAGTLALGLKNPHRQSGERQ